MYKYLPTDSEHIHIFGRCIRKAPLALFWTASGIEFNTDSSEIWIDIECDYEHKENFLRFELDGVCIQRFMVMKGRHEYCILRGFEGEELKNNKVLLEAQPMGDDASRKLLIHGVSCDRLLQPVCDKNIRIEFVGDSITSGEGLGASALTNIWCTGIYGLNSHYAVTTANHFEADYSIVSQSGWGVYCGWDNNMNNNIPSVYTKVCGVVSGSVNEELGASCDNDFDSWQPDIVVVNLGTNDGGASSSPEWTDPDTGKTYQMKRDGEDKDTLDAESADKFETAAVNFLKMLREKNKEAHIVWAYGMCDHFMEKYILEAIDKYKDETEDEKVDYVSLPECRAEQLGAHGHPGIKDHEAASKVLIAALGKYIG